MPQNVRLIPQRLWHNQADRLVPITHSLNLSDAVNAWNPLVPVFLVPFNSTNGSDICDGNPCNHIQNPAMADVFDFIAPYQRAQAAPAGLAVRTDEAKAYYWLDVQPAAGAPRWTQVQAAYYPLTATVTAVTSDSLPVTLGINVGATPAAGPLGLGQTGLGMTAARYWVTVDGGAPYQQDYVTGYLTVTLPAGQARVEVAADRPIYLPALSRGP
jgi:hypothetical protein